MNKVMLIGNLTRDPELSTTPSGVSVCKFSIAVGRKFANADGTRDVDFFNIVSWRGLAENVGKFLKKGKKCCVVGQIQNRNYEAQDGSKRHITEIIADEVEFLSPQNNDTGTPPPPPDKNDPHAMIPVSDDNLPF